MVEKKSGLEEEKEQRGDIVESHERKGVGSRCLCVVFHIDITLQLKRGDRSLPGIYEIKGDTLKICYYSSKEAKRPTEFSANDSPGIACITLTRAKK